MSNTEIMAAEEQSWFDDFASYYIGNLYTRMQQIEARNLICQINWCATKEGVKYWSNIQRKWRESV